MRKSTVFISAVLTTFALVMLYRVASAYNGIKTVTQVEAAAPTSLPAPTETEAPEVPAPTTAALGPTDAAQLAAKVVGNTNLLSAETSSFNGVSAYLVTFTNNDMVYVGLDGQILSVQVATPTPVVVNVPAPTKAHKKNNGSGGGGGRSPSGGSHDDHDDHEEHDD
jgi:hypothetical protein